MCSSLLLPVSQPASSSSSLPRLQLRATVCFWISLTADVSLKNSKYLTIFLSSFFTLPSHTLTLSLGLCLTFSHRRRLTLSQFFVYQVLRKLFCFMWHMLRQSNYQYWYILLQSLQLQFVLTNLHLLWSLVDWRWTISVSISSNTFSIFSSSSSSTAIVRVTSTTRTDWLIDLQTISPCSLPHPTHPFPPLLIAPKRPIRLCPTRLQPLPPPVTTPRPRIPASRPTHLPDHTPFGHQSTKTR